MTPEAWLLASDPLAMLEALFPTHTLGSTEPQPRRSRLYLIACARRCGDQLPGVCRVMLGLAERTYGGPKTDRELGDRAYPHAEELYHSRGDAERLHEIGENLVRHGLATAAEVRVAGTANPSLLLGLSLLAYGPFSRFVPEFRHIPVELHSAHLVREVFGDLPPRPPALPHAFEDGWRTDRVKKLAGECERNLTLLPRLADELQRVGCDRRDVLEHLRKAGPHTRECWALQLALGNDDEPLSRIAGGRLPRR